VYISWTNKEVNTENMPRATTKIVLRTFSVALSVAYETASLCVTVTKKSALYSSTVTKAQSTQIYLC